MHKFDVDPLTSNEVRPYFIPVAPDAVIPDYDEIRAIEERAFLSREEMAKNSDTQSHADD